MALETHVDLLRNTASLDDETLSEIEIWCGGLGDRLRALGQGHWEWAILQEAVARQHLLWAASQQDEEEVD